MQKPTDDKSGELKQYLKLLPMGPMPLVSDMRLLADPNYKKRGMLIDHNGVCRDNPHFKTIGDNDMLQSDVVQSTGIETGLAAKIKYYLKTIMVADNTIVSELIQIDSVCKVVGLQRRTLQRKLKAEDTTYLKLLEEVRKQKSHDFIVGGYSVNEITKFLGFKHHHCYIKAHQRWVDFTPPQYRKVLETLSANG